MKRNATQEGVTGIECFGEGIRVETAEACPATDMSQDSSQRPFAPWDATYWERIWNQVGRKLSEECKDGRPVTGRRLQIFRQTCSILFAWWTEFTLFPDGMRLQSRSGGLANRSTVPTTIVQEVRILLQSSTICFRASKCRIAGSV